LLYLTDYMLSTVSGSFQQLSHLISQYLICPAPGTCFDLQ